MKTAKLAVIAGMIVVVGAVTAPIWGGCDFKYQACRSWCDIRHFNSNVKKVSCKAGCAADKLSCVSN